MVNVPVHYRSIRKIGSSREQQQKPFLEEEATMSELRKRAAQERTGTLTEVTAEDDHHTEESNEEMAQRKTKQVKHLRVAAFLALLVTAVAMCLGVYLYTKNEEEENFRTEFEHNAEIIVDRFITTVEKTLGAIDTMSASITSYAVATNSTFPFVTVPDFEVSGANLRTVSGTFVATWLPLVTDETRDAWEEYAEKNRYHINEAFEKDSQFRSQQDALYPNNPGGGRFMQALPMFPSANETILRDGTMYHPRIWSSGMITPRGDAPVGSGPFLPMWQIR
jgi:hypothetical protein